MSKKAKKIWSIRTMDGITFTLHDENGVQIASVPNRHMRNTLSTWAFEKGADEVNHDYDNVKVDGSGSGT